MESISAEVVLPSLSYPADLHNEAACHHIISSHCFEGVPELPVDDAEHPDSGTLAPLASCYDGQVCTLDAAVDVGICCRSDTPRNWWLQCRN